MTKHKTRKTKKTTPRKRSLSVPHVEPSAPDISIPTSFDIKVTQPDYSTKTDTFFSAPDFEPTTVSYPNGLWNTFKATWPNWVFDLLPVFDSPQNITLHLYRRASP